MPEDLNGREESGQPAVKAEQQIGAEVTTDTADAWADSPFGYPTSIPTKRITPPLGVPDLPEASEAPPKKPSYEWVENEVDEKPRWQIVQEQKEAITEAHLSVRFNHDAIRNLLHDNPDLIEEPDVSGRSFGETILEEYRERVADLQATLEAISKLPETITFEPGITLIVGENGLGKSTLARSIQLGVNMQDWIERETIMHGEADPEMARAVFLDTPEGGSEPAKSGLVRLIAPHLAFEQLATFGAGKYYDMTVLYGQHDAWTKRGDQREIDLLRGGVSHRQRLDSGLDYIRKQTAKAKGVTAEGGRGHRRNEGPQIYFIDEPEVGMSPRRQHGLINGLEEVMYDGSIALVPTNNVVLFDSDLPRIDLEHPERGIFRPSEYPEDAGKAA